MATTDAPSPPLDGDQGNGNLVIVTQVVMTSIALTLVLLRCCQMKILKAIKADDICIILGMIFGIVAMSIELVAVHNGFGRHMYYLSPEQLTNLAKSGIYIVSFVLVSVTFTKLSFSIYLLRLVKSKKTLVYVLYGIIAFTLLEYLLGIILIQTQCRSTEKGGNESIAGNCVGSVSMYMYSESPEPFKTSVQLSRYLNIATSAFTDLLLALLPVYFLWDVQISFRNKLSICCLTGLGMFTAACAVGRAVRNSTTKEADITWTSVRVSIWATLELNSAIIAACVPALRPLFIMFAEKMGLSTKKTVPNHPNNSNRIRFIRPRNFHPAEVGLESCLDIEASASGEGYTADGSSKQDLIYPSKSIAGIEKITDVKVTNHSDQARL